VINCCFQVNFVGKYMPSFPKYVLVKSNFDSTVKTETTFDLEWPRLKCPVTGDVRDSRASGPVKIAIKI
jgi:hypothetical protein